MSLRSLVTRRNHDPFLSLNDEVNRMFNGFFGSGPTALLERDSFAPRINVTEGDKAITVSAELPGVNEGDFEVAIDDGVLTIKGEKKNVSEKKEENFYHSERVYGSFQRSVRLPSDVDGSKAKATYEQGVLRVELPRAEGSKRRTIAVKAK